MTGNGNGNGRDDSLAPAVAALRAGRPDDAVRQLNDLLARQPDHADALHMLGVLCCSADRHEQGARLLSRSVALAPGMPGAWPNLGNALSALNRYTDAAQAYERVLALNAGHVDALIGLARCRSRLKDFDAAERHLRRAIEIEPEHAVALARLAELCEESNRVAEALALSERGLAQAPDHPMLNLIAARCERRGGDLDAAAERLENLTALALTDSQARAAAFEQVRVYDRLGQTDAAWQAALRGNALAERSWSGAVDDAKRALDQLEEQLTRFTPALLDDLGTDPVDDGLTDPVFLVGFPRSGTTLLDQILDGRPQLQVMMEKTIANRLQQVVAALPGGYPQALSDLTEAQVRQLRQRYFDEVDTVMTRDPEVRLLDKLPLNTAKIALLYRVFPGAHFVFAARHPMDVVLSCFLQDFELNHAMANFLSAPAAARYYAAVMALFERFRDHLDLRLHVTRYEDLVDDPEAATQALFAFLDLPWDASAADHTRNVRERGRIDTPSYHQVAEPLYRRAVARWRRYADHLEDVRPIVMPYASRLGYP